MTHDPLKEAWADYPKLPMLAKNALMRHGLKPNDVARLTDDNLLDLKGIGAHSLAVVRQAVPHDPDAMPWHDEHTVVNGKSVGQWRTVWRAVRSKPRREERVCIENFCGVVERALARAPKSSEAQT